MLCTGALNTSQALAGGLWTYEVGTDDVGLASAGYGARAQDASTVLTNPAGMTRLDGTQVMVGAQALYGDLSLSMNPVRAGFSAGGDNGGNPIGWFPGGSFFISHSITPDFKIGFGTAPETARLICDLVLDGHADLPPEFLPPEFLLLDRLM